MSAANKQDAWVGGPNWEKGQRWDCVIDKIADVPIGVLAFISIAALMACGVITGAQVDNAKALLTAAGLLGVGHAIHTGSKHLRR